MFSDLNHFWRRFISAPSREMIGERQLGYGLGNTRMKLTYLSDLGKQEKIHSVTQKE